VPTRRVGSCAEIREGRIRPGGGCGRPFILLLLPLPLSFLPRRVQIFHDAFAAGHVFLARAAVQTAFRIFKHNLGRSLWCVFRVGIVMLVVSATAIHTGQRFVGKVKSLAQGRFVFELAFAVQRPPHLADGFFLKAIPVVHFVVLGMIPNEFPVRRRAGRVDFAIVLGRWCTAILIVAVPNEKIVLLAFALVPQHIVGFVDGPELRQFVATAVVLVGVQRVR